MDSSKEIELGVKEVFQKTLKELNDQEVDLHKKQDDFESWDSFAHMELVSKTEEKFGITLEMDEVITLDTPQKFVDLIRYKILKKC